MTTITTMPATKPSLDRICYNKDLDFSLLYAYAEASKRFVRPVVICGHGADSMGPESIGIWTMYPDKDRGKPISVQELALQLNKEFPDRDIVLFICNEKGKSISVARVWYFKTLVWVVPDSMVIPVTQPSLWDILQDIVRKPRETRRNDGPSGSIWEVVTQGGTND